MPKSQPNLPDQFDIETALTDILEWGDRKVISHHGRFHYDKLCDSLKPENPEQSDIFRAAMFLYGTLFCDSRGESADDREKARKVFGVLLGFAESWGLVSDSPIDLIKQVLSRLQQITRQDIKEMSMDELIQTDTYLGDLIDVARDAQADMRAERRGREVGRGRNTGLDGGGIRERLTVGSRRT
ncbi:MAG TPA: hypothetical protein VJS44_08170 [Pyrinomonadaceae bacterium]|nr:hypothetical protein [Pyrinomonadaceae bacterium]